MCLGIPGEVLSLYSDGEGVRRGRVRFGGIVREVCLDLVPEAEVGDYVVVHVGFAISRIDPEEAGRIFELLSELGEAVP